MLVSEFIQNLNECPQLDDAKNLWRIYVLKPTSWVIGTVRNAEHFSPMLWILTSSPFVATRTTPRLKFHGTRELIRAAGSRLSVPGAGFAKSTDQGIT